MAAFPDFFLAGAPKAGTTSLYHDLQAHPDICMSDPKETWYFFDQQKYARGLNWYASRFFDECGEGKIGEATPGYMAHPQVPSRIFESIGSARFIFLLRDPVERAFSQFHYDIQRGVRDPDRSFSEVIRDPEEEEANPSRNHVGLLELGRYADHLARFEGYFGRENLLPILFRDYTEERSTTLRRVCDFLNVEPISLKLSTESNPTAYPRNRTLFAKLKNMWRAFSGVLGPVAKLFSPVRDFVRSALLSSSQERPPMSESDRQYLRDFYAESNTKLAKCLDRDLSHWT